MSLRRALGAAFVAVLGLDCGHHVSEERPHPHAGDGLTAAHVEVAASETPNVTPDVAPEAPLLPGARYASLSGDACHEELVARGIAYETVPPRRGVASPVRLRGPLSGVTFHTLLPEKERAQSSFEILDCRLVLALDDFAKLLVRRNVVEVMHFSAYRPPPAGWDEPIGLRHEGGIALDVGYFRKRDGTALNVEHDFAARPDERLCVPAPPPRDASLSSIELRRIVCDAHEAGLFHVILTPNYDWIHRNHFHFELTPGATKLAAR